MKDRWGKAIIVGWAEHEILWVKAAIKLPRDERSEAFRDIAAMTTRTELAVREKAKAIRAQQQLDAVLLAPPATRRVLVPNRAVYRSPRLASALAWAPTKAQLMGGR